MYSKKIPEEFRRLSEDERISLGLDKPVAENNQPQTYLIWAVLATIFCFPITGIIAIGYSAQVGTFCHINNFEAANYAAKKARFWCIMSPVIALTLVVGLHLFGHWNLADFGSFPQDSLTPFLPVPGARETMSP